MGEIRARPSLREVSMFTITWLFCTVFGLALLTWSLIQAPQWIDRVASWPFATVAVLTLVTSCLPVTLPALKGQRLYLWWAFVFAALYLWGLSPAVVLTAAGTLGGQVVQRKSAEKWLFNAGMYILSVTASWLVIETAGFSATGAAPMSASAVVWMAVSWVVFILVNMALVAGLAAWTEQTWWESFSEDAAAHALSMVAVLSLSPLIAIVAVAGEWSWIALWLLLIPVLAIQKVADSSREQEHQALHDPLTGLANRLLLTDRIEQALARGVRHRGLVVLLFVDVDHFKGINDTLGHQVGDELLVSVADRLRSIVRPGDTLVRYAGDEFIIVCEQMPGDDAASLASRIAEAIREPHRCGERDVTCTVSIGLAVATEQSDAQSLIIDADAAMYRAKSAGRDTFVQHQ